jgi:hypothetical protein
MTHALFHDLRLTGTPPKRSGRLPYVSALSCMATGSATTADLVGHVRTLRPAFQNSQFSSPACWSSRTTKLSSKPLAQTPSSCQREPHTEPGQRE